MEDTVITNAGMEPTTEAAPVDAGQDVSIAELLGVEQQQEPAQTVNQDGVDGQRQEAQPEQQKEIGEAFARESRRLEAKYRKEYEQKMQADPAYAFGSQMLRYIAQSRGLSLEDAAAFAQAQYVQAIAQTENISPTVAQMLFHQPQPQGPAQEQAFDAEARADEIRAEIAAMELPEGFDFSEAVKDEAFAQMLIDYPTAAAVRIYHAEKRAKEAPAAVAEQLRARAAIPQSMKPQQPVTPKIDFHSMSTEEFAKVEERVKAELAKGNRIKF